MDYPPYPKPKKIIRSPKEENVATDSPTREEEVVPRLEPMPRVVCTIEDKGGGYRAPEGPREEG